MSGTVYSNNWTDTITANSTYSTIVGETYDVGKNNAVVSIAGHKGGVWNFF